MQRRKSATGTAVLLAALLTACTGGSGGDSPDDGRPGQPETTTQAAEPGKYRTLPEACAAVDQEALDSLLPGIRAIPDEVQRDRAYAGAATATYDTDRQVGCRWKAESAYATHHLSVDFERVVSYDPGVSDDDRAEGVYAERAYEAGLTPAPPTSASPGGSGTPGPGSSGSGDGGSGDGGSQDRESGDSGSRGAGSQDPDRTGQGAADRSAADREQADEDPEDRTPKASATPEGDGTPSGDASPSPSEGDGDGDGDGSDDEDLASRLLDDLGDSAFLDDRLGESSSTSRNRTVTVVFRTSNVIVTIHYDDQPVGAAETPDSKEMQDRARELARRLDDKLDD